MSILTRHKGKFFIALATLYLFSFPTSFPAIYIDEPWESITAFQLYAKGQLNNPTLTGRTHYDQHFLVPRVVQTVTMGLFYHIFGLHYMVGRISSLLYGLATLFFFYKLLRREKTTDFLVFLGVGLLLTNSYFFIFARLIRPEIVMTFLGLAAFYYLYRGIAEERLDFFAWSGLCAGIGVCSHPNYTLFLLSLYVILSYEFRRRLFKSAFFWNFTTFVLVGLLPYLAYLIYQDFENGFTHFWAQISPRATQGESGFFSQTFIAELDRYREYVFFPYRVVTVLVEAIFIILSLRLKDRLSRFAQLVIVVHLLIFPILIVHRSSRYFLPLIPFVIILIIQILEALDQHTLRSFIAGFSTTSRIRQGVCVGLTVLLVWQLVGNPVMAMEKRGGDYDSLLAELRTFVPPGARVWGSMIFWFGFADCNYRTQYTYARDLDEFRPEYLRTHDNSVWGKKSRVSGKPKSPEKWRKVREPIEEYAARYGHVIAELEDVGYGRLQVWKVDVSAISQ